MYKGDHIYVRRQFCCSTCSLNFFIQQTRYASFHLFYIGVILFNSPVPLDMVHSIIPSYSQGQAEKIITLFIFSNAFILISVTVAWEHFLEHWPRDWVELQHCRPYYLHTSPQFPYGNYLIRNLRAVWVPSGYPDSPTDHSSCTFSSP